MLAERRIIFLTSIYLCIYEKAKRKMVYIILSIYIFLVSLSLIPGSAKIIQKWSTIKTIAEENVEVFLRQDATGYIVEVHFNRPCSDAKKGIIIIHFLTLKFSSI